MANKNYDFRIYKGLASFFCHLDFSDIYSPQKYALFWDPRTFFDRKW